jgi:hypothetical protein
MAAVFFLGVLVGGGLLKLKTWVRPEATSAPPTTPPSPSPSSSLFSRSLEYTADPSRIAAAAEERADLPEDLDKSAEAEEVNILSLFYLPWNSAYIMYWNIPFFVKSDRIFGFRR